MAAAGKTIVISDIHMSDGQKYSWFRPPYPGELAAMLNTVSNDSSLVELVLLGDVFDLWVYPLQIQPWTVVQIIQDQKNFSVIQALRQCVQRIPNVYYITGNHDMEVVANDLVLLNAGGKHVQLISPKCYNDNHQGQRHLEHGHAVDMFNAPDDSSDTIGGYPLGYFITRLVATASNRRAARQALKKHLLEQGAAHKVMPPKGICALSRGSRLVEEIIDILKLYAGVKDSKKIRFSQPNLDNKYTVGDIKKHYGGLYSTWMAQYPNHVEFVNTMLVSVDKNGLDWYARRLLSQNNALKVVLMGHTHHALSMRGYDNDGCWCIQGSLGHGDRKPHYVEIDENNVKLVSW